MNKKAIIEILFGFTEATYYRWKKEERPIVKFIELFNDKEKEEFLTTEKIKNFQLFREWSLVQYKEIKRNLTLKIFNLLTDENGDLENYGFIDTIMSLLVTIHSLKTDDECYPILEKCHRMGFTPHLMTYHDIYNFYILNEKPNIFIHDVDDTFDQHKHLNKFTMLSTLSNEEGLVFVNEIQDYFTECIFSVFPENIEVQKGIVLLSLILFVYFEPTYDGSSTEKIDLATNNIVDKLKNAKDVNRVNALYFQQMDYLKEYLENYQLEKAKLLNSN